MKGNNMNKKQKQIIKEWRKIRNKLIFIKNNNAKKRNKLQASSSKLQATSLTEGPGSCRISIERI